MSIVVACTQSGMLRRVGPPPDLRASQDAAVVERGRYLAENVAGCIGCHSERDWEKFGGPRVVDTEGEGGEVWDEDIGFPGTLFATNITPAGVGDWTDGELVRAITAGAHKDGHALFPVMPYKIYATLTQADALAIVAFLRTLDRIEGTVPARVLKFPMGRVVNAIPEAARPTPPDSLNSEVSRGEYLSTIAGCAHCHTPQKGHAPDPARPFAGGHRFEMDEGTAISVNITPDVNAGIGAWNVDGFVARFQNAPDHPVPPNSPMPWSDYTSMTEKDLRAIWAYLETVPPDSTPVTQVWESNPEAL